MGLIRVRPAVAGDEAAVAGLASELGQSFVVSRTRFEVSFRALFAVPDACLLVADRDGEYLGYLLGFWHFTFYANGPVGWVEEIIVGQEHRGLGVGRALMTGFEQWAAGHGCALVALATRRAAPFYLALGYEESATYLRKILPGGV